MLYKRIKNLLIGWSYGRCSVAVKNIQTTNLDRISLSFQLSNEQVRVADFHSYTIQYLACLIAFLLPLLLYCYREKRKNNNMPSLSKSVQAVMLVTGKLFSNLL